MTKINNIFNGLSGSSKAGWTPASTNGVVTRIARPWIRTNKPPIKITGKISLLSFDFFLTIAVYE